MRLLAEEAFLISTPSMLKTISGGGFPPDESQMISEETPAMKGPSREPPDSTLRTGVVGALKTVMMALLNAGGPCWRFLATEQAYFPLFFSKVTF